MCPGFIVLTPTTVCSPVLYKARIFVWAICPGLHRSVHPWHSWFQTGPHIAIQRKCINPQLIACRGSSLTRQAYHIAEHLTQVIQYTGHCISCLWLDMTIWIFVILWRQVIQYGNKLTFPTDWAWPFELEWFNDGKKKLILNTWY